MIGYVTLGTNDFARAQAFYDALLEQLGAKRFAGSDTFAYWGKKRGLGMIALCRPYDGQPATAGNGTMVAVGVRDRATVDRVHARGLALGAADEGAPGPRGEGFYGAYLRDLDGNKLCFFTYENAGPPAA
jgi:catechol 2,3-dioxygenase-like lactoylglutathione lyase family enzyme